jgi:predicted RNase H-like HicB family nuclease
METCPPVSILCRFWTEDEVWNGVAEDLPVAACGQTFEEARRNLSDALVSHLESASELGKLPEIIRHLQQREHDFLPVDEIPLNAPLLKIVVAMKDREFLALNP